MSPGIPQGVIVIAGVVIVAFILIFIAVIVIFVFVLRMGAKIVTTKKDLLRNGQRITATVTNIQRTWEHSATPGKTTNDTVYYVTATAPDPRTGQPLTFRDKRHIMPMFHEGDPVIVIIDPSNPARYMFASS